MQSWQCQLDLLSNRACFSSPSRHSRLCTALLFHFRHLATIKAALAPGGTMTLHDASGVNPADVALSLMMQEFAVTDPAPGAEGTFTITATVPSGEAPTVVPVVRATPAASAAAAWGVVPGASDALVDEDALLAGDDAADGIKASGDCSTKPRACANCSCGRAEAEAAAEAVTLTEEQLQSFTSSCGNCAKGDAFRCASCPHRGKPAFKPGMEGVVLDLGGDDLGAPIMVG